jgi:hypothetical protein
VPPTPLYPINGQQVSDVPAFKWTPAEGALNYTLQISEDPTFSNVIEEVTTDTTAYTSSATYPAFATLYWRVRGNDLNKHHPGLAWSSTQTFTRGLPTPQPLASNPRGGEAIPVLSWTAVPGALGYEVHAEQPDGTTKDFKVESTAFTVTQWDGPGVWRWQARALFPTATAAPVAGGYFEPQPFAHTLGPPPNARGTKSGSRIVISWSPEAYANKYEVGLSTDEAFSRSIESHKAEGSSWAPLRVDLRKKANRRTLYWRVAAVDNKGNVGPYATGSLRARRARCATKHIKRHGKSVKACVRKSHATPKKHASR